MRVAQLADVAEVHQRMYGVQGAVAMARSRRGGHLDPTVVDAFTADAEALFPAAGDDPWDRALSIAPDAEIRLDEPRLDELLTAIGDFVDLKCPFTLGHSRNVAALAEAAAVQLGLPADDVTAVRRAGHLHDVGRLGVSNQVWSKPAELTGAEWERVRMHPYLTDRVLTRITGLAHVAAIARAHHEHLDGSGYPLGLAGPALGRPERLLAAAVAYQSALEPRPYREPHSPEAAAARLKDRVTRGALDADSVDAVLAVAGHARDEGAPRRRPHPSRDRDPRPRRPRPLQPRHRDPPRAQREDGPQPRRTHLRQDRRHQPGGREPLRPQAGPGRAG